MRAHGEDGWQLRARATVRPDARPGRWPVSYDCGGTTATGYLKVKPEPKPPYAAIGVQDEVIEPGKEVLVMAGCQDPDFVESEVGSPVLTPAGKLRREEGDSIYTPVSVLGTIDRDARPGTYPIWFHCVDRKVTG